MKRTILAIAIASAFGLAHAQDGNTTVDRVRGDNTQTTSSEVALGGTFKFIVSPQTE